MRDTKVSPRPSVDEPQAQLDWVRSLNPSAVKTHTPVPAADATPHPEAKPRLVRNRVAVKPLSTECGVEPFHHSQCDAEWCKCLCHDTEKKLSLACLGLDHAECNHGWCTCKCHPTEKGGE